MGWNNPPVPWRELRRRMAWRLEGELPDRLNPDQRAPRQVKPDPPRLLKLATPREGVPWAELHCHSSYSFLDGAATPGELVTEAARLGLETLAITDHDGMYGVPQFAQAAARLRGQGARLNTVFGAELSLDLPSGPDKPPDPPGRHLLVLARDAEGYARLSATISAAQLAGGEKGRPVYDTGALAGAHGGGTRGAGRRRAGRGLAGAGPADRDVRP
jgi:error-prone DNA polymerase